MKAEIWAQLKNIAASELVSALEKDGWIVRSSGGSAVIYKKLAKKVVIHVHSHKTFGAKQLRDPLKISAGQNKT
jgi:predicted RNA binding protein YcfA (HicA-like mRNA interferase family)